MRPEQVLWDFVEACYAADTVESLGERFLNELDQLGFPFVALASHVDPLAPPKGSVMLLRYPSDWVAHFSAEQYQVDDPVFHAANRETTPFRWSDQRFRGRLNRKQLKILDEASEVGLAQGFTIPIRGADALPASCSLVAAEADLDLTHYKLAHAMSVFAHERARRLAAAPIAETAPRLTRRERQVLTLAAQGKSDWVISTLLGVSENAVNRTVERAKTRLDVATRTQAIMLALHSGEISLHDIVL